MLDKNKVRTDFNRHAFEYDKYAVLQNEIVQDLLKQIKAYPKNILDLGCGTGSLTIELARIFPFATIHAIDLAEEMIKTAQFKACEKGLPDILFTVGDMEFPDFPEETFDLIISSSSLQWANDIEGTFQRINKLLKPEGCFLFSLFGQKTLFELKAATKHAFAGKDHPQEFHSKKNLEHFLKNSNYRDHSVETVLKERYYDSVKHLFRSLKRIGAQNASADKEQTLVTKAQLNKLLSYYEKNFKTEEKIRATYEIVFGKAFR